MQSFYNPAVLWSIVGFVFFMLEFAVPGLVLFFFAIGALIVAFLTFFIDLSINSQLIIFIATSLLSIVLFRKWLKEIMYNKKNSAELEDEFIGKIGMAESFIGPGENGKVDFKGTTWDAKSEETISRGENVTIIGNESIVLIVKSTKNLL